MILFSGCALKKPIYSTSSTIIFKTPTMKFYDKGFITKYDNYIELQIFNVGQLVLNLKIYKDEICKGTLQCMDSNEFNNKYFDKSYKKDFLYNLFSQKKIYFKDKQHNILIKVK
jgi:hypothetical protein